MLILKILGWILLGVLGLILFLLLLILFLLWTQAKVHLSYDKEQKFRVSLQYLWIKKQLLPSDDEDDGDEEEKRNFQEKTKPAGKLEPVKESSSVQGLKKSSSEKSAAAALKKEPVSTEKKKDKLPEKDAEKNEKEKPAPYRRTENTEEQEKAKEENDIFAFHLNKTGAMLKTAGGLVRRILQSLHYDDIVLRMAIRGKDAADCAVKFGQTNAALNGFFNMCKISGLRCRFQEALVIPDFGNADTEGLRCAITIRGRALWVLMAVIWAARQLMKEKILFPNGFPFLKKKKKAGGKKI